ncbi:MAG: hypothetical protein SGARI_005042 [Bacillariaceae sp.]
MPTMSYVLLPSMNPSGLLSHPQIVAAETQQKATVKEERIKFLLFLKILIQHLRDTRNYYLLAKAQLLIKAIVQQNRIGDPHFASLMESIERRLRSPEGEQHWRRAHFLMR